MPILAYPFCLSSASAVWAVGAVIAAHPCVASLGIACVIGIEAVASAGAFVFRTAPLKAPDYAVKGAGDTSEKHDGILPQFVCRTVIRRNDCHRHVDVSCTRADVVSHVIARIFAPTRVILGADVIVTAFIHRITSIYPMQML